MYKQTNEYVFDRVFDSIRKLVILHKLLPGERLNIEKLAEEYDVSTTPVREVLNRLVAEDLIDMIPKLGFFTKHISESEIRDFQELNHLFLDWSLGCARKGHTVTGLIRPPMFPSNFNPRQKQSASRHAKTISDLFAHVATQSGNSKIIHHIHGINDRLYYLRLREYDLIENVGQELSVLCELYHQMKFNLLQDALKEFHIKRSLLLPHLIKSLNRELQSRRE